MAEPPRSTNTVKVSFSIFREVKINNDIHRLNVDTSS